MPYEIYPGQIECKGQFLGHKRKKYYIYSCEMVYSYEKKRFLVEDERAEITQFVSEFYNSVGQIPMIEAGLPKTEGEMLVVGSCYNNYSGVEDKTTSAISVKLADIERKFIVFGDRRWLMDSSMSWSITPPEPFEKMPIASKFAFGGAKFPDNPIGKGYETEELPNVELPGQVILSKNDSPAPAILDSLSILSPSRMALAGTADANWSKFVSPDYPDDMTWDYFNTSVKEQRKKGFFKGNEAYEIVNMDPFKRKVEGVLPDVYMRAFYSFAEHPEVLVPGEMFLDTITFIPDKASISMVWRLVIEVQKEKADDLVYAMFAYESYKDEPRSFDYYKRDFEWRKKQIKEDDEFRILITSPLVANGDKSAKAIEYENMMAKAGDIAEDKYANEKTEEQKELQEKLDKSEQKRNKKLDKLKKDLKSGDDIAQAYDNILSEMATKSTGSLSNKVVESEIASRKQAALKAHQDTVSKVALLNDEQLDTIARKQAKEKNYNRKNTDIYDHINAIDDGSYELFFGLNEVDESLEPADYMNAKIDKIIPYYTTDHTLVYGDDMISKKENLIQKITDEFGNQEQIKALMKSKEMLEEQKASYMKIIDEQADKRGSDTEAVEKAKSEVQAEFDEKTKEIDKQIEDVVADNNYAAMKKLPQPNKMKALFRDKDNTPKLTPQATKKLEQQYSQLEEMLDDESMKNAMFEGLSPEKIKEAVDLIKKTKLNPALIAKEARKAQEETGFDFKAQYRPVAHTYPIGSSPHEVSDDEVAEVFFDRLDSEKERNDGYIDMTDGDYACLELSEYDLQNIDFSGCYFEQVNFDGADLSNCIFEGAIMVRCSFDGTILAGADFKNANLGDSNFVDVDFKDVRFYKDTIIDKCYFSSCEFDYLNFDEAPYSQVVFENCDIKMLDIYKSMFNEMSFINCSMGQVECVSAIMTDSFMKNNKIEGSSWHRTNFSGTVLSGVEFKNSEFSFISFSNMSMDNCKFAKNKFTTCSFGLGNITGCSFVDAEVSNSSMDSADFFRCDFTGADLNNSSFSNGVIKFTNFFMANLMGSTFRYANVKNTDFSFANLWLADFAKVTLGECTFTGANTKDTIFDGWKP